jgi:hypothetical protein
MFWQPLGTYCLNMATFEFFFPQNVATWAYFSKENPLYPLQKIKFLNKDLQIFHPQKKL